MPYLGRGNGCKCMGTSILVFITPSKGVAYQLDAVMT